MINKSTYMTLKQLKSLIEEPGYCYFGHGTGRKGNSDDVVDKIFEEGLKTYNNSLIQTTICLDMPTPEIKKKYKKIGLTEPNIENIEYDFSHFPHLDSKKIIILRLPIEYINTLGDKSDLNGEMYGAFFNTRKDSNGNIIYYVDTKFILGCYDAFKKSVRLNENFESILNVDTIKELRRKQKRILKETIKKLENQQEKPEIKTKVLSQKKHI